MRNNEAFPLKQQGVASRAGALGVGTPAEQGPRAGGAGDVVGLSGQNARATLREAKKVSKRYRLAMYCSIIELSHIYIYKCICLDYNRVLDNNIYIYITMYI